MLNPDLKLNTGLFEKDTRLEPIKKGFGEGLAEAAESDERIVGLCADLTESVHMDIFKKRFPERFVEMGVAEQNLATVASGMASMGKIPFIASYGVFSPGRNWEQIRTTICLNDVPVKIAGSHAGVSVGPDGATHQALEDIALTRVLPNMTVLSPCDYIEAKKATMAAAKTDKPVYIRLAREKTPIITGVETPFEIGKASLLWRPERDDPGRTSVSIIVTGSLAHEALKAARQLEEIELMSVYVLNMSTIKPLDEGAVKDIVLRTGAVVTVEEHQKAGGLGSAIAEFLSANHPVPIEFVGVDDKFGQSGNAAELISHYRLAAADIISAARKAASRK